MTYMPRSAVVMLDEKNKKKIDCSKLPQFKSMKKRSRSDIANQNDSRIPYVFDQRLNLFKVS